MTQHHHTRLSRNIRALAPFAALFLGGTLVLWLACGERVNPYRDLQNVEVTLGVDTLSGQWTTGDTVSISIRVFLPNLVDSVQMFFGESLDTSIVIPLSLSSTETTFVVTRLLTECDSIKIIAVPWLQNGTHGTSASSTVRLLPSAPVLNAEGLVQASGSSAVGAELKLYVSVTSCAAVAYQWYKNDTAALEGKTTDTLTFESLTLADNGAYRCVVSNSVGADTSQPYVLRPTPPANQRPVFVQDSPAAAYQIDEGDLLTILFRAVDPDGDSVAYSLGSNNLPRPGTAVLAASSLTWQSQPGDEGAYKVVIAAADGNGGTAEATIDIAVGNVNLPPRVTVKDTTLQGGDTLRVKEGQTVAFTVQADDPNAGDTAHLLGLVNAPYQSPSNGAGSYDTSSGVFSYTPSTDVAATGAESTLPPLLFRAKDNGTPVMFDTLGLYVTVVDSTEVINQPPVARDTSYQVDEDNSIDIKLLAYDVDDGISGWVVSNPNKGTLSGTGETRTYTTKPDSNGTDVVKFRARDAADQLSNEATVTITVNPVNDPPTVSITAPAGGAKFLPGQPILITADASDAKDGAAGGINLVEFNYQAGFLGQDPSSPFEFLWTNATIGSHSLFATATDNSNASKNSSQVSVSVVNMVWTEVTPTGDWPVGGVASACCTAFKGKMWLLGGLWDNGGPDDTAIVSSPDGISWQKHYCQAALNRLDAQCITYPTSNDTMMWLICGTDGNAALGDVWKSGNGTDWIEVLSNANSSIARSSQACVVFKGKMWIVGGDDWSSSYLADVRYSSDGKLWNTASDSAKFGRRSCHGCVVFHDTLWVIGGLGEYDVVKNDVWKSADGITWTPAIADAGFALPKRGNHSCIVFDDKIWVIGGYDENIQYCDEVYYSENGKNWYLATDAPGFPARAGPACMEFDNRLWVIGGSGQSSTLGFGDVWYWQW